MAIHHSIYRCMHLLNASIYTTMHQHIDAFTQKSKTIGLDKKKARGRLFSAKGFYTFNLAYSTSRKVCTRVTQPLKLQGYNFFLVLRFISYGAFYHVIFLHTVSKLKFVKFNDINFSYRLSWTFLYKIILGHADSLKIYK